MEEHTQPEPVETRPEQEASMGHMTLEMTRAFEQMRKYYKQMGAIALLPQGQPQNVGKGMFEAAQRVDGSQAKLRNFHNQKRSNTNAWLKPRGNIPPRRSGILPGKRMGPPKPTDRVQPGSNSVPTCLFCRKAGQLEKDCLFKQQGCFACGSTEHYARECPNIRDKSGPSSQAGAAPLPQKPEGEARKP
ncbi:OLC1v1001429C1 [Oldenlandia corymbosa var. corymbosa]|uniref:OLC1v1001429C1 n=1 Tax=Oldenlandia corymbosa var. corymbosa TaxID=529605 RepID=A0AAV1D568_OLDCO|nr:OLC1v1001429C1 [Oldenlandia corymbosa var. corymbosa]